VTPAGIADPGYNAFTRGKKIVTEKVLTLCDATAKKPALHRAWGKFDSAKSPRISTYEKEIICSRCIH
jgi:hypothetical protein